MVNASVGWAVTDADYGASSGGQIWHTVNGGTTWTVQFDTATVTAPAGNGNADVGNASVVVIK